MSEKLIRMHAYEPLALTAVEFAAMEKELASRRIAGEWTIVERLAHALWKDNRSRYLEIYEGRKP